MVSFYAFPVVFIDTVAFKKGTLIKTSCVRTLWTPPGSAPGVPWRRLSYARILSVAQPEQLSVHGTDRAFQTLRSGHRGKELKGVVV